MNIVIRISFSDFAVKTLGLTMEAAGQFINEKMANGRLQNS